MRSKSNPAQNSCQADSAKTPAQEWATPAQISRIFGFSERWYRKSIRQRLRAAGARSIQVSEGDRGLRWNIADVAGLLGGAK